MNGRWLNNFIAVCVVILYCAIVLATGGCTFYRVVRDPDGIVTVEVKSTRSFEAPDLRYRKFDSQGHGTEFDFKAAGVDNNTDALIGMFSSMMMMMQQMMIGKPVQ